MKSRSLSWLLLGCLLLSGACLNRADDADDEYEDVERAHLVIHKTTKEDLVVQGRNVTVTISLFNAGAGSAKSVSVKDTLPAGATLLSGSLEVDYPVLASGSSVENTYVLTFTSGGSGLLLPQATVTYAAEEGSTQTGHSSTVGVFVMTPVQQITRYAVIAGSYVSLGIARSPSDWRNIAIVVGLVGALVGGNVAMKSANTASTSRKRQRALKELEKDE